MNSKMDSNLTSMWVNFFTAAGIPSDVSATYALTFTENRIQNDMLLDLNKEYLRDMGISRMGDVIAILRHAKQVHENTARDKVLSTTVTAATIVTKVPVAAVTGRATVTQPSSPASRILEHYTRNPHSPESPKSSNSVKTIKRKSDEMENSDMSIKQARLIRFSSPPKPVVKDNDNLTRPSKTVFSRLGNSEAAKPISVNATAKPIAKPIYARLGNKSEIKTKSEQAVPIEKSALKYEGILKAAPKKAFMVTTSKNVRKISCTMRADETPVSVKDKLDIPKAKSVKFSNHIQYKEIETVKVLKPKPTTVFNKPERRLSMPENSVKARLGQKNVNNLTITKNVFNRLGV